MKKIYTVKYMQKMMIFCLFHHGFAHFLTCFIASFLLFLSFFLVPVSFSETAPASYTIPITNWVMIWQGDSDQVSLSPVQPHQLHLEIQGNPKGVSKGTIIGTPVPAWVLTPSSVVTLTTRTFDQPIEYALAVRTDQYYESPRILLAAHTRTSTLFKLSSPHYKSAATDWKHTDTIHKETPITSLELVCYPVAGQTHQLDIIDMQLNHAIPPEAKAVRKIQDIRFEHVAPIQSDISCYGKFEIRASLTMAATNPFNPAAITLDALFLSPSGQSITCPGFLYAWATADDPYDEWRVRFTPHEPGLWQWQLKARTPEASIQTALMPMEVSPSPHSGILQVCKENPQFFEFENSTFFYPLGHNVCWNSLKQYQDQFAAMNQHGENWSRIWMAPWNCGLEWSAKISDYEGLQRYNLRHAKKLDHIFESARDNDIYLQLVLHEHCRVSAQTNPEWHNNPYNKALGGPCATPESFFFNEEAKHLTRNRIRYIIARYGYSPNLMAWELFNEVDLSDHFNTKHDSTWHHEMAQYIKQTDPHGHMLTTSYITTPNIDVFKLPEIDFTQSHVYIGDIIPFMASLYPAFKQLNKPHFIAEFGRNTDDGVDGEDTTGQFIHAAIWANFMLPEGGNAMSWWWYDLIDPNQLYYHYAALGKFAAGLDRRAYAWKLQTGKTTTDTGFDLQVLALTGPDSMYLWLYDPTRLPWSGNPPLPARAFTGQLHITGINNGIWTIEQWDTYKGTITTKDHVTVSNRSCQLTYSSGGPDMALKIMRQDRSTDTDIPTLELNAWDPVKRIGPRQQISIPQAPEHIIIDGQLTDWARFPTYTFSATNHTTDNVVAFSLAHDDGETLYVAAYVKDDHLIRNEIPGPDLWKDDTIEIWIDARNDADFFHNMPQNPGCWQINLAPASDNSGTVDHVIYRNPSYNNMVLTNITAASSIQTNGYIIEAAIPLTVLRGTKPVTDPYAIGFSISNCDADPGNKKTQWRHILWQGIEEFDARQWSEATLEKPTPTLLKGAHHGQ